MGEFLRSSVMTQEEMQNKVYDMLHDRCDESFFYWLASSGYYIAPAARSHHNNFAGGLFYHSLNVAQELRTLTKSLGLRWESKSSPEVIGLLHDVCKIDDYTYDGSFEHIEYKPTFPGHGSKSIYMLSGRIDLTEEEKACIMFHMGSFTDKSEWNFYTTAIHNYPNVLYTHTADMIASHILEV